MTTRTKSKPVDLVAESRALLSKATAEKRATDQSLAEAQADAQALRDRLAEGDASVRAEDLARSDTEVERLELLAAAALRGVRRAEQALVNDDTTLAEAVAPALEQALQLPVSVVTSRPNEVEGALPAAFLVQSRPSQRNTTDGYLSGEVELMYFRTHLHREVVAGAIENAASAANIRLSVRSDSTREQSATVVDTVRISVGVAYEPAPVIAYYPEDGFRIVWFASNVARDIERSMQLSGAQSVGVRLGTGDATAASNTVVATAGTPTLVSDQTDEEGLRRRVIELEIAVQPGRDNVWGPDQMRDKLIQGIELQHGRCHGGLGRVSVPDVITVQPAGRLGRRGKSRFEFVSRQP